MPLPTYRNILAAALENPQGLLSNGIESGLLSNAADFGLNALGANPERTRALVAALMGGDFSGAASQAADNMKYGLTSFGNALTGPSQDERLNAAMGVLGIVSPSVARGLNYPTKIPDDQLLRDAVTGTPNASLTDEGLMMRLTRNQKPEQSMQPSVRGGVFYLPEGAAQQKHYSTGKSGYGGSEKIQGETLIKSPITGKGGTGGKAPQSAYDSIMGKGAYDSMRSEALKTYGRYGAPPSERTELVYQFLEKHAPELADYADYIVQNSKQGNQLAYALQEAAVGSAARKAGYDSIVGISKGKQGPFISEVFDLREAAYPDKLGGYQLHKSFEK